VINNIKLKDQGQKRR